MEQAKIRLRAPDGQLATSRIPTLIRHLEGIANQKAQPGSSAPWTDKQRKTWLEKATSRMLEAAGESLYAGQD